MPTDLHFGSRPTRAAIALDALLAFARRCLIVVAALLAILLFIQLQVTSWRTGTAGQDASPELEMMMTSP